MKFKSDIEVQAGLKDSSGSAGTSGKILSSTGTGVAWVDDNPGITGSGTTNYIPKFIGASAIGNSLIFDNGTNVGIGTSSPGTKLELNSGTSTGPTLRLSTTGIAVSSNTLIGEIDFYNSDATTPGARSASYIQSFSAGTSGGGDLRFGVSANAATVSERMRIASTGVVTINNLSGTGSRMVIADANGLLSTQTIPTGTITGSGTTNYISKFTSSSAIGNSLIYDGGSVGINTATPSSTSVLTLQQSASLSGALSMLNRNANQRWLFAVDAFAVDDKYLAFIDATTSAARMVIATNGNVGIGNKAPSTYGHGGTNIGLEIYNGDTTANAQSHLVLSTGAAANTGSIGTITFAVPNTAGTEKMGSIINANIESNSATTINTNLNFETTLAGVRSQQMRIKANGYVGIGTPSPTARLHVKSTSQVSIIESSNTDLYQTFRANSADVGYIGNGVGTVGGGSVADFGFQSINNTVFATGGGTESMRITSSGNLLIGTQTDSGYRLQVKKTSIAAPAIMISGAFYGGPRLQVYGLDDNPNGWMGLGTDMSGGIYEHSIYYPNTAGNGRLSMGSYNGTTYSEKMCINPSGNVGIGTNTPSASSVLTLQESASLSGALSMLNRNGNQRWLFAVDAAAVDDKYLAFIDATNNSVRMVIGSNGNVGILNAAPGALLNVGGSGTLHYTETGMGSMLLKGASGSARSLFEIHNGDGTVKGLFQAVTGYGVDIGALTNNDLIFSTNGNRRMVVTSGGLVGIGVTNPVQNFVVGASGGFGNFEVFIDSTTVGIQAYNRSTSAYKQLNYDAASHRFNSNVTSLGTVFASGTGGFASSTYISSSRNPIWRFGNADGYGLSYFQGSAGIGGVDTIGFHFGTATAAGSQFQFIGNGNAVFSGTSTATGFFNSSDIRLKEIVDYDYSVSNIKPISYLWKDLRDNKKHVGYSAQEVQKVMPDAVNEDADGMLSVNYIEVLVAKIAELENRIKQLEK